MEMYGFNLGKEYCNFEYIMHLSFTPYSNPIVVLLPSRGCFWTDFRVWCGCMRVFCMFFFILYASFILCTNSFKLQDVQLLLYLITSLGSIAQFIRMGNAIESTLGLTIWSSSVL
jgi:hypothetical protein